MFQDLSDRIQEQAYNILGLRLSPRQTRQFCIYGDLLLDWNQRVNLTRITDPEEVIVKHFVDSLAIAKLAKGNRMADIGTGAGFPGIPIKIINPDCKMYLVDSGAKKLEFLEVVIAELGLINTETIHARAEDFGRNPQFRNSFDTVTSRAVARLPVLLEYAIPLLKQNGQFLAAKGLMVEEELKESGKALDLLGGELQGVENFTLGVSAEHRAIVIVKKVRKTPEEYPRRAGTPTRRPLV